MGTHSGDLKTNFFRLSEMQTLCLGDATINNLPHSLKSLRSSLNELEVTDFDVFAGLMYILAVECGYSWNLVDRTVNWPNYSFDVRKVNAIPSSEYISGRNGNDERRFILYLAGCEYFKCTLLMRRFETKVVANFSTASPLLCFSEAYFISKYVDKSEITFSSLPELNVRSKDQLFYKMKCHVLPHNNIKFVASLQGLPPEIIFYLGKYLETRDFRSLCKTNRYFYENYYRRWYLGGFLLKTIRLICFLLLLFVEEVISFVSCS